jgi:hypothetical protein
MCISTPPFCFKKGGVERERIIKNKIRWKVVVKPAAMSADFN